MTEYAEIIKKLAEEYKGDVSMLGSFQRKDRNPFYILISTILSVRNTDESTTKIADELLSKYPTPQALANADKEDVAEIVKKMGLWKQKVNRVINTSRIILEEHDGKVPRTYEELMELPGVGTKVAGCVLVYAFDKDYIPADTHVHRVANRLGWVDTKRPPKTENELMEKIPRKWWKYVNEVLVLHGKKTCTSQNPKCEECPISQHCDYYAQKT